MKIKSNKTFECYDTAYESWGSGKDITLDGIKLMPITIVDKIRTEIIELDNKVCQQFLIEDADKEIHHAYQDCLAIIDKYKAELESEK